MTQPPPFSHYLSQSLDATIGSSFDIGTAKNLLQQLLAPIRSPNTRKAYEKDLKDFFKETTGKKPTSDLVLEFLHLERGQAVTVVLRYKAALFARGLSEATVNRRLAAVKALVAQGRAIGIANFTLEDVKGEKIQRYRDTTGIDPTFSDLPVSMLTSRTGEKHRQLAMTLGASGYFSKPYNERELLDTLEQLIRGKVPV